jgi:hypothetical protein
MHGFEPPRRDSVLLIGAGAIALIAACLGGFALGLVSRL